MAQPQVIPTRHGFLAVSGHGAEFNIGVTGPTEEDVLRQYEEAVRRRRIILGREPFRFWTPERLAEVERVEAEGRIWDPNEHPIPSGMQ